MNIEQLSYFVEVYRRKSINSASLNLNISQQSLSRSISSLEKELSIDLFVRTAKGVTTTCDGERFYKTALNILDELQSFIDLSSGNRLDHCKIGYALALSSSASQLYQILNSNFPNVFFDFVPITHEQFIKLPLTQYPDIIFTYFYDAEGVDFVIPDNYKIKYLSSNSHKFYFWLSRKSPFAKHKIISLKNIHLINLCYLYNLSYLESALEPFPPGVITSDQFYFAQTHDIFMDFLKNKFYATIEICSNNKPLMYPDLLKDDELILKPIAGLPSLQPALLYNVNYEKFYSVVSGFFDQYN